MMLFIQNVSFNTQPPKGGWILSFKQTQQTNSFNTQPPKGGWNYGKLCFTV